MDGWMKARNLAPEALSKGKGLAQGLAGGLARDWHHADRGLSRASHKVPDPACCIASSLYEKRLPGKQHSSLIEMKLNHMPPILQPADGTLALA